MKNKNTPREKILLTKISELQNLRFDQGASQLIDSGFPFYLLAAFPKSGSTYTSHVLAHLLRAENYQDLCNQYTFTPKDIVLPGVVNGLSKPTISQLHIFATGANLEIIKVFNIQTVVLVRNIFDVVVSLCDHMKKVPFFANIIPEGQLDVLDEGRRVDYVVDTLTPWLCTFYATWWRALKGDKNKGVFVTYESMVSDPVAFFYDISQAYRCEVTINDIHNAMRRVGKTEKSRFNVGVVGRGKEILTKQQKERILSYLSYFPDVNFSLITQ